MFNLNRWKGENVSTSEVEAAISNIVKLKDCIVYGIEVIYNYLRFAKIIENVHLTRFPYYLLHRYQTQKEKPE